jgi:glycosyltransferase involved in cell wall biosynthesis
MKKVLFVLPTLQGGGAEKVISTIASNFNNKKYQTKILVFNLSNKRYLKRTKIKIIDLKKKRLLLGTAKFIKTVNKINPDIIISSVSHLNLYISLIKFLLKNKIKVILRESNFLSYNLKYQSNSFIMRFLYKFFYNSCDKCLVFSKKHKIDLIKNTNIQENKVKIVANPIEFKRIKALSLKNIKKNKRYFKKNNQNFLIMGSLSHQKGIDIILRSLKYCKSEFNINIVGEGSEYSNLKYIVNRDNLDKKINFLPFQENPFSIIRQSDALISPSRFEGMSNVILETLALDKPILYFNNNGASTDLLKKTNNNFMLKSKNPNYIANIIDIMKFKKTKSNKKILKKFDLKNIINIYEKIIDDLL